MTGSLPMVSASGLGKATRGSAEPVVSEQVLQVPAEVASDVVAFQGELDRRFEVVQLVPDVVPSAIEPVGEERLLLRELIDRVGELDLATGPRFGVAERVEDVVREHVSADRRQV